MASLFERIVAEIDRSGPIAYSRFVDLALYDPEAGFYATGGAGRRRDFLTSPEVGPLFGVLVGRAIDRWWHELGRPTAFDFVEVGAGPGTLARSILRSERESASAMRYVTVESAAAQRATHPEDVEALAAVPEEVHGILFANELLDNLPFDVYDFDADRGWREVRVARGPDATLVEELVEGAPSGQPTPPTGCRVPVLTSASAWLADVLGRVDGVVAIVDYVVDRYPVVPERRWLRTYRAHERGQHPLQAPGSQDITIDVDLSQLAAVAPPSAVRSQVAWLTDLGIAGLVAEGRDRWEAAAARPDLAAFEARSRVTEAAALRDPSGLGAFSLVEWLPGRVEAGRRSRSGPPVA